MLFTLQICNFSSFLLFLNKTIEQFPYCLDIFDRNFFRESLCLLKILTVINCFDSINPEGFIIATLLNHRYSFNYKDFIVDMRNKSHDIKNLKEDSDVRIDHPILLILGHQLFNHILNFLRHYWMKKSSQGN